MNKNFTSIDACDLDYQTLNEYLRQTDQSCHITNCCGQRYIASGFGKKQIIIDGVPGNALGAYLNGASITVHANAQDAVGDTMNDGEILIHGNVGDAAGYAMRGGHIYVKGNAGYRAGIHMKAYENKFPVMIIGGSAGSFLGEYQAGGVIVVLGLNNPADKIVGFFPCTGMHGGKMFLRSSCDKVQFPTQVTTHKATEEDLEELKNYLARYCELFDFDMDEILGAPFTVITPNSNNPYKQMYISN